MIYSSGVEHRTVISQCSHTHTHSPSHTHTPTNTHIKREEERSAHSFRFGGGGRLAEQRSSVAKPRGGPATVAAVFVPGDFLGCTHTRTYIYTNTKAARRPTVIVRRPPSLLLPCVTSIVLRLRCRRRRTSRMNRRGCRATGTTLNGRRWSVGLDGRWRRRRARTSRAHGGDANAGAQRNERGRQRNVGLSSVPALCRPFKLSVPPCLETPCK